MVFEKNNTVLKILVASRQHVGCYVVVAHNGVGRVREQRGYLQLNSTVEVRSSTTTQQYWSDMEVPLLRCLGILVVLLIFLIIVVIHLSLPELGLFVDEVCM